MAQLKIPYESLDPLTIGASGDEEKVYREELELEIPDANLLAAIYPDEPEPVARRDRGGAGGARVAGLRAALLRAPRGCDEGRRDRDRQPVPADAAVDACCRPCSTRSRRPGSRRSSSCANGKVFPMSESDIEQKIGRENLDRMERMGIEFHQNEPRNAETYTYVGVSSRGTPVWLH